MPPRDPRAALALRINDRVFYGWVMLAVGALGMFASGPAQSHIFSVFITPIGADLDLSRTSISSAYAGATLVAALGLPYVGSLIDRLGVRRVILIIALLLGAAAMAFGQVTNIALLAIGFAALRFLGQGSLMLSCSNLVAQWFSKQRGFALSLLGFGFSISMAVHPPLAQWLIDTVGWRNAWLWLGALSWLLLLPPIILLVQNRPEDLGLLPDGERPAALVPGNGASATGEANIGLTRAQALRTPAFWIIAAALSTFSSLVTAIFFHQVSIFESHGLSAQMAASLFSVSAMTAVLTMPVIGRLLDRFPTQPILAGGMLTMSVSMLALVLVRDLPSALVYSVAFGITNAAIHTQVNYVWPRFFGRRHLGSIQGIGQTVGVVASSIGPVPFGLAFDLTGSYTGVLVGFAVLPVACAVALLFMRPPDLQAAVDPT